MEHLPAPISGAWFVCPTPFADDGALDLASVESLVEATVAWGVDGLTVLGARPGLTVFGPGRADARARAAGGVHKNGASVRGERT